MTKLVTRKINRWSNFNSIQNLKDKELSDIDNNSKINSLSKQQEEQKQMDQIEQAKQTNQNTVNQNTVIISSSNINLIEKLDTFIFTNKASKFIIDPLGKTLRKNSKIPSYFHAFDVCKRTSYYGENNELTKDELCASALLHDILEDTKETYNILLENFNSNIANTVKQLTNEEKLSFAQKYSMFKKFVDMPKDVIVIKIADRVCNVLDFYNYPETSWYACAYALQAYHLFASYYRNFGEGNSKILSDIFLLESIVRRRYDISLLVSKPEDVEKVLFSENSNFKK